MQDHKPTIVIYCPAVLQREILNYKTTGSWLALQRDTNGKRDKQHELTYWQGPVKEALEAVQQKTEEGLESHASQPALPSILLSNVRSLENKLDYNGPLNRTLGTVCMFTWLNGPVPRCLHRADRDPKPCDKTQDGGLCVFFFLTLYLSFFKEEKQEYCTYSIALQ